jgi:hypothetical protein
MKHLRTPFGTLLGLAAILVLGGCAAAKTTAPSPQATQAPAASSSAPHQYTFGWSFADEESMKPRGGVTTGAPVTLRTTPNPGWLAIREPGIDKFEKDRRAILAMEGVYRVTFDFIETVPLRAGYNPARPYQSWATEFVEVIEDSGDFISLQHILVMYVVDENGNVQGPMVAKHWRQDWKYEDTELLEYRGNNTWKTVTIPASEAKGKWSQAVYQVDDMPRYEGIGEWTYDGNYYEWTSDTTWRPLPRREFTAREDYNVLSGVNRVTINPGGWVHEQDNIKIVVDASGKPLARDPYVAKETGLNRYELIEGFDYQEGIDYWQRTAPFWADVREAWAEEIAENQPLRLRNKYEDKKVYEYLFEYADNITSETAYDSAEGRKYAKSVIENFVITTGQPTEAGVY